jgi:hypothetical protein
VNTKATADAIAARFAGVTATLNGTVEGLVSAPTASLPDSIAKGPVLLVYHPTAALEIGVNRMRNDHYVYPVRLLRDPIGYPTRSDWLYAWHDATRDRVEGNVDLDLPYVARATLVSARVELDGEEYAGVKFDVVEFAVSVLFREVVATVSI